jgi:hypothetical protein
MVETRGQKRNREGDREDAPKKARTESSRREEPAQEVRSSIRVLSWNIERKSGNPKTPQAKSRLDNWEAHLTGLMLTYTPHVVFFCEVQSPPKDLDWYSNPSEHPAYALCERMQKSYGDYQWSWNQGGPCSLMMAARGGVAPELYGGTIAKQSKRTSKGKGKGTTKKRKAKKRDASRPARPYGVAELVVGEKLWRVAAVHTKADRGSGAADDMVTAMLDCDDAIDAWVGDMNLLPSDCEMVLNELRDDEPKPFPFAPNQEDFTPHKEEQHISAEEFFTHAKETEKKGWHFSYLDWAYVGEDVHAKLLGQEPYHGWKDVSDHRPMIYEFCWSPA